MFEALFGLMFIGGLALVVYLLVRGKNKQGGFFEGRGGVHPAAQTFLPTPPPPPSPKWLAQPTNLALSGAQVPVTMIYFGQGLPALKNEHVEEPALIDPSLPVNWQAPDHAGGGLPYYPSYSYLTPEARAAFLAWLGGGRRDPQANIGYVFLFFYGIERRVLSDGPVNAEARAEVPRLCDEVQQLLAVYGEHRSFKRYATKFLSLTGALFPHSARDHAMAEPPLREGGSISAELPFVVKTTVGQMLAEKRPIPADWALAWYLGDPETKLRMPAKRCFSELVELFAHRYQARYGAGLELRENKRRLKIKYKPASATFARELELPLENLPDISGLRAPLKKFKVVVDQCTDELAAYSRFRAKSEEQDNLKALSLLPPELLASRKSVSLYELKLKLHQATVDSRAPFLRGNDLISRFECKREDRMTKGEAKSMSGLVGGLGYGLEPDVRYGGSPIKSDSLLAAFKLPNGKDEPPSRAYASASLLLHLGAIVAAAEGQVGEAEEQRLEQHLETALHLNESDSARLAAHLRWLLETKPGFAGVKKRLTSVDTKTKAAIGRFAVIIAGADGRLDPAEIKVLTKIYKLLGFETQQVYSDIHELGGVEEEEPAPAHEPITVREPRPSRAGFAIPEPPPDESASKPAKAKTFILDMGRVQDRIAETEKVSALLSEIFVDDEATTDPEPESSFPPSEPISHESSDETPSEGGLVDGLDAAHSELLRQLAVKESWTRDELEERAAKLDLLPDGAIDTLNEAAYDRFDEPVLDGDDPIEVIPELIEEMLT